jgi:hypothetical protein
VAVYVDPNFDWPKTKRWPFGSVSHMYADKPDELHAFAAKIGLKRIWASDITQPNVFLLHYDLSPAMRAKAVRHGAVEVNHEHAEPYRAAGHPLFRDFQEVHKRYLDEYPLRVNWEEWEVLWRIFLAGGFSIRRHDKETKK